MATSVLNGCSHRHCNKAVLIRTCSKAEGQECTTTSIQQPLKSHYSYGLLSSTWCQGTNHIGKLGSTDTKSTQEQITRHCKEVFTTKPDQITSLCGKVGKFRKNKPPMINHNSKKMESPWSIRFCLPHAGDKIGNTAITIWAKFWFMFKSSLPFIYYPAVFTPRYKTLPQKLFSYPITPFPNGFNL